MGNKKGNNVGNSLYSVVTCANKSAMSGLELKTHSKDLLNVTFLKDTHKNLSSSMCRVIGATSVHPCISCCRPPGALMATFQLTLWKVSDLAKWVDSTLHRSPTSFLSNRCTPWRTTWCLG